MSTTTTTPEPTSQPYALQAQATLGHLLDRLTLSDLPKQEQGRRFERLVKRFLQAEPKFVDQYSDVWLWNEWPGRGNRPDNGIDLVAKDRYTGELTGIQAGD